MAAVEYPPDIIDTRGNIGIVDTRDTTDVFQPVPFRRVIKRPAQRKTKANNDRPSRPAPFPTSLTPAAPSKSSTPAAPSTYSTPRLSVDVLDAFDLRDRTNLWALLGATVPASPPDIFALLLSTLTVLLQLRAPLPTRTHPPHPAPFTITQK